VTGWWRFWNAGGNWLLFLVAFCLIEAPGLWWGQQTMSRTLWAWYHGSHGWITVLVFQALALFLFYHFFSK
jgi:hypothetical protein